MIKDFRPDLLPKVRKLDIKAHRDYLSRTLTGSWLSTFKGRGIEFSDYRQYTPGDDAAMIDWRASLRARKTLVKELTEEKNLNVFLFMDVSDSMLYGSGDVLKAEYAVGLASSIAYAAVRAGDAVGLVLYADEMKEFVQPSIGVQQHSIIQRVLRDPETWGGGHDFAKSITEFMGATRQRGLILFISDFLGMPSDWKRYVEIASARFEMIGLLVRDPRDRRLPKTKGEYVLQDPYSEERLVIDSAIYAEPYRKHVEKEEQRIQEVFHMVRGDALVLETSEDFMHPLMRFFHKRAVQVEH